MKRREAIKKLALASGSLVALPSWAMGWSSRDLAVATTSFTSEEQALMTAVADTIIPASGDSPGALTVDVHKFLIRLFEECYEEDVRDNIKQQLHKLNESAERTAGKAFAECGQAQREDFFLAYSESRSGDEEENKFFQLLKGETIRGFRTSKTVMQDYYGYQVVPGHYNGNADVEA